MDNWPLPGLEREVEEAWRQRVLAAKARYARAVELQSEEEIARGEYLRVLEIFSGFVLHGRPPGDPGKPD